MMYKVRHLTSLAYAAPVSHASFNLRLMPWGWGGQSLKHYRLNLSPRPAARDEFPGPYCVNTSHVSFLTSLTNLEICSEFTMEIAPLPEAGDGIPVAQVRAEALATRDLSALSPAPYLYASRIADISQDICQWADGHLPADVGIVRSVSVLMGAIYREFTYQPGATTSATPPHEAFGKRAGVCQDFAHIMIMGLRSMGIPAAYVSGYLRTVPPPGQARLVGADAMHAWVNVWCGQDAGWIGFDPTNDCLARQDHILIAMGRDYADVAPIDGIFIGAAPQKMDTSVDVEALE